MLQASDNSRGNRLRLGSHCSGWNEKALRVEIFLIGVQILV